MFILLSVRKRKEKTTWKYQFGNWDELQCGDMVYLKECTCLWSNLPLNQSYNSCSQMFILLSRYLHSQKNCIIFEFFSSSSNSWLVWFFFFFLPFGVNMLNSNNNKKKDLYTFSLMCDNDRQRHLAPKNCI